MEIVRQYTNRLDNFLSSVNAEVIEPDQISHRKLVIKDLARQKPFSPKGRRYRDALIWETVLDTVHRHGEDVIFVTDNNSDFPTEEDGTLHKGKGSGLELSGHDAERPSAPPSPPSQRLCQRKRNPKTF